MSKITPPVFTSLSDPALTDILRGGGVGVLLTDTVYGIVGLATDPEAAAKVIDTKGRKYKPGTLIAADVQQLLDLGLQREHVKAAEQFWPGPVSVVLPTKPDLEYLDLGMASLAVRVPKHQALNELLTKVGPLLTTSANRPNEPMVKDVKEAQAIFGNRVAFYVDSGRLEAPLASTIIRFKIELLRQGEVSINPDSLE